MRKLFALGGVLLLTGAGAALAGWDEGVAAFGKKDFQTATQEFQQLVDQNPDEWRGHYMLGLSLEQMRRQQEALNHLRKAYDLNPNELSVKLSLGRAYKNVKRYGDVAQLLGSVDPESLPSKQKTAFYQMRGEARLESGDANGGLEDFKVLAKLNPQDAQLQFNYGVMAAQADKLSEAIDALGTASRLAPNDKEKKRAYINVLVKQGRISRDRNAKKSSYTKAAALSKELVAADPSYDNLILKCSAELGAQLYQEATSTCDQAVTKNHTDWLAPYYAGQAYTSTGQYQKAAVPLQEALKRAKSPNDVNTIWKQLGFVFEKEKRYSDSIDAYTRAGDQAGVARVKENERTAKENALIEAENDKIKQMQEEAKRLEEELKALEEGGGGR